MVPQLGRKEEAQPSWVEIEIHLVLAYVAKLHSGWGWLDLGKEMPFSILLKCVLWAISSSAQDGKAVGLTEWGNCH